MKKMTKVLALVLALALAIGLLAGRVWPALAIAALGIVAWHLRQFMSAAGLGTP